jgi:phospholipid transport system transporter-binding protein
MFELPPVLTHKEATATLAALGSALRQGGAAGTPFEVDAARLERFDSSALALLLAARRDAESLGRTLQARNLTPQLQGLARLYGVAELVGVERQG